MKGSRVRSVGLGVLVVTVNVMLVALVAIGVSQRGFSGWWATLRGEWQPLDVELEDPFAVTEDPSLTTDAPTEDGSAVTTAPPTTTEEPEPPTVAERYEDGEDLTVLVLGDLMGTHENDWPAAWGRMLSAERTVAIYPPLAADPTRYSDPLVLGGGEASISIYNSSLYEGTPGYAAERLDLLAPDPPDVVLVSYGRSNTPEDLPDQLAALWKAIGKEFPDAESHVIVEPPRLDGLEPTTEATRRWAKRANAPLIDVAEVFEDEGIVWATQSMRDPLAVNIYGGERWAQVVQEAVLGRPVADQPAADAAAAVEPTTDPAGTVPTDQVWEPPVEQQPPVWTPPPWTPPPAPSPEPTGEPTESAPAPTTSPDDPSPSSTTEPSEPSETTGPEPTEEEADPGTPSGSDSAGVPSLLTAVWV